MKLKYIIPLLLVVFAINAQAQTWSTGLSYSMGFGVSNTSDYISKPAFSGFNIEGHKLLKPNISVGLTTGWNVFSEKGNEVVQIQSGAVSGEHGKYLNIFPILVNASYYFTDKRQSKFVPFARAHVGTYYIMQRFDVGVYTFNNDNWHFGIAPEVGFMIAASRDVDILVNSRFNYAFDSGTQLGGNTDNSHSYISLNIGISYYNF